ncbi:3-hydroxyisobutyrate dehydrogenase [Polycladidibacter stylochi]|uniref:3-hydroxyisobutyrate dehydrogenase n=1 Tax=Polycladidibacter stylochi TaxID=1807766 RepID=UPI000831A0B7|nr:3-hydroxyisobutyrate dehydrogenase [Pseudovibrio stylochi]
MGTQTKKICFIGLGNMGLPMAQNLLKAGHSVTGYDLSEEARSQFMQAGGGIADSVGAALNGADTVVTMLPKGEHVKNIYLGENGVLSSVDSGSLLIDSSTIDVATSRYVADKANAAGMKMVDAPVSGGVVGATQGTLTFMVGGEDENYRLALPLLEVMGKSIVHAGKAGAGQAAKICNNMLLGISMVGTCEAFVLADKLGLAADKLFEVASTSSGQCWSLTSYCPVPGLVPSSPANNDYKPGFAAAMMLKDLLLANEAAEQCQAVNHMGQRASELYKEFCKEGGETLDFSGIMQFLLNQRLVEV